MLSSIPNIPVGTVKRYIAERIREAIVSGTYKPGERLNETKLAAQFEVSTIPVREALLELQEQGLVENRPKRGMFVIMLNDEDVQRISSLRIILEAEALKLCRMKLTPEAEAVLLAFVDRLENWQAEVDLDACMVDLEFHRTIWRYADNPYLEKILNTLVPMLFSHQALVNVNEMRHAHWPRYHHRALLDVVRGISTMSPEEAIINHLNVTCTNPERYSSLAGSR
jgi:DNA-binding GntR family transcriptional regulator